MAKKKSTSKSKSKNREPELFALLKEDHRTVKEMMSEIEDAEGEEERLEEIFLRFREEVMHHSEAEEVVLYPQMKEREETREIALEAEKEHEAVNILFGELEKFEPGEEEWMAQFTVLCENLKHHIEEEEGEAFKKIRAAFEKDEIEEMGAAFEQAKKQIEAAA